jgi:hypothetical protein
MTRPLGRSDARGRSIGVPSAELSLGWLLASRASLRFTRPECDTARSSATQAHSTDIAGQRKDGRLAKVYLRKGQFLSSAWGPLQIVGKGEL